MLYSVEPRSSQWPSMVTRICGYERKNSAVLARLSRASARTSDLLKSKNASFTFCSNNSLKLLFSAGASTAAAPTVTRASDVAVPPGPVAVICKGGRFGRIHRRRTLRRNFAHARFDIEIGRVRRGPAQRDGVAALHRSRRSIQRDGGLSRSWGWSGLCRRSACNLLLAAARKRHECNYSQ